MKRLIVILLITTCIGLCIAGTHDPWDGTKWDITSPDIDQPYGNQYKELYDLRKGVALRMNREHVTLATSSVGGWHLNGSAVCYEGTTAEPNLPDDSAALSNIARDRGRLWLDDNFDPPVLKRWTGTAYEVVGTIASGSAPIAYLISDANENTDGGRESKIIFKGEKDDDTSHELIMIQGSHDGTGDDYKADLILSLNDGDDAAGSLTQVLKIDSAKLATFAGAVTSTGNFIVGANKLTVTAASGNTAVAGTLDVTGNTDPTTYETTNGGFQNSDTMASAADTKVASSDSIVKYATLDAGGVLMHDAEGSFNNADVNGTKTKVYTKYLTGTLDADDSTSVAHGIADVDKILSVTVLPWNSNDSWYMVSETYTAASANSAYVAVCDATNVIIGGVGSYLQGQKYRIKIDYLI